MSNDYVGGKKWNEEFREGLEKIFGSQNMTNHALDLVLEKINKLQKRYKSDILYFGMCQPLCPFDDLKEAVKMLVDPKGAIALKEEQEHYKNSIAFIEEMHQKRVSELQSTGKCDWGYTLSTGKIHNNQV